MVKIKAAGTSRKREPAKKTSRSPRKSFSLRIASASGLSLLSGEGQGKERHAKLSIVAKV